MPIHPRVDPELESLLDAWPAVSLDEAILERVRARVLPLSAEVADTVAMEQQRVAGPKGAPDIGLIIYRPATLLTNGCIYHIHGGGYVTGKADDFAAIIRPLAQLLGCVIVSVDYRLAPETRHPGPIEDCYAGLAWTYANCARYGADPARIGIMGESAGGGLAAALTLLARDRGGPALAFQCLTYPMLDDRTGTTQDPFPNTGEHIWTPHNNRFGWRALLGRDPGGRDTSCYAAAARADDLSALPPTFIVTGGLDLFLRENVEYATRLMEAGIICELHVYPGAFHGFDMTADAAVARSAREAREHFLRRMMR